MCVSIRLGVVRYYLGRKWYRVGIRRLRVRVKGRYRRVRRVGKTLRVLYGKKTSPIRFRYGKLRFFNNKRWRRPSTRRGRRARRRRKRKRLMRYWRRTRRRRRRRRRRYGKRNGTIFFKYGNRFRIVRKRRGQLKFLVGNKYYRLR